MRAGRRSWTRIGAAVGRSLVVWAILGLIAWLDRHTGALARHADVFSAIWAAIQVVGNILGDAGAAIAATLEGVVAYLATAVAWLAGRVASILVSTGAVFAKVWDAIRVVWSDVLKPALVWIDEQLTRVAAWLKSTLKPVFDFLARVRDELQAIYKRFVQPIIDTIEFLRQLNRVLLAFHIHLLQQLDTVLQQIETRIEEPILWLNAQLSKIFNSLDLVLTLDGVLQRLTLIKSMSRYAPSWLRIAVAARSKPLSGDQAYKLQAHMKPQDTETMIAQLGDYWGGASNDTGAVIDAAADRLTKFWDATSDVASG
jgi:hypothetical protein